MIIIIESVLVNETDKILFDFEMQIDCLILIRKKINE